MLLQRGIGYALRHGLREARGLTLDHLPGEAVDLAVVDGLRQVVGEAGGPEVQPELHIHDERLAELALRRQGSVPAVEDHALQDDAVVRVPVHTFQYMAARRPRASRVRPVLTFGVVQREERRIARPAVTVSYAQTLDGRLATLDGSSKWISAPDSLCFAHEMRAAHGAVMVGVGTVTRDDPRLTVRLAPGESPLRVVVDSSLRTPMTAAVLAVNGQAPEDRCREAESLGARILRLPPGPGGGVELGALLRSLGDLGVRSVMVEGGATLITALLRARLVDRLAVCVAPKILGTGIEAVGDLGIRDLAKSLSLSEVTFTPRGGDLLLEGSLEYPADRDGAG